MSVPRCLPAGCLLVGCLLATSVQAQKIDLVTVTAKPMTRTLDLPGELQAFDSVSVHAKVRGYVERMLVDRGSLVKRGQVIAELSAPELNAQIAEGKSKVAAAESEAQSAAAEELAVRSTYERLKQAAQTPGAIAGNELVIAEKRWDAARALSEAKRQASDAARASENAERATENYLRVTAPFDGIVTERGVSRGALVGPGTDPTLAVVQQVSRLRLVLPVPEQNVGSIERGSKVTFTVPAFGGRAFTGTVARSAHALDEKTRTMAIELDVNNRSGELAPGMFANVKWPVSSSGSAKLVPRTSVVTTTERVFVIRERGSKAEWVDVTKGPLRGDLMEISGEVQAGDQVVRRASDEIRQGAPLR